MLANTVLREPVKEALRLGQPHRKNAFKDSPWPILITQLCENMLIYYEAGSGKISLDVMVLNQIQSHITRYFFMQWHFTIVTWGSNNINKNISTLCHNTKLIAILQEEFSSKRLNIF